MTLDSPASVSQSNFNPAPRRSTLKPNWILDQSHCVFKRAHGLLLGIDVDSGPPQLMRAVAGDFLTYAHEVNLIVLGIETITTIYFAADENFSRNVLGRQGWLDRVRLGLVDYDGKLYLSAYDNHD